MVPGSSAMSLLALSPFEDLRFGGTAAWWTGDTRPSGESKMKSSAFSLLENGHMLTVLAAGVEMIMQPCGLKLEMAGYGMKANGPDMDMLTQLPRGAAHTRGAALGQTA